jgi:ATP-dependent protease HslVU (ClpYQ) ATPase subunit
MQEIDNEDGDRINVSISRKAYDALVTYTRQVNEKDNEIGNKPFTIEEVLDEEIIFLFSDESKKDSSIVVQTRK